MLKWNFSNKIRVADENKNIRELSSLTFLIKERRQHDLSEWYNLSYLFLFSDEMNERNSDGENWLRNPLKIALDNNLSNLLGPHTLADRTTKF